MTVNKTPTSPKKSPSGLKGGDIFLIVVLIVILSVGLLLARWKVLCDRGQTNTLCPVQLSEVSRPAYTAALLATDTPSATQNVTLTAAPEQNSDSSSVAFTINGADQLQPQSDAQPAIPTNTTTPTAVFTAIVTNALFLPTMKPATATATPLSSPTEALEIQPEIVLDSLITAFQLLQPVATATPLPSPTTSIEARLPPEPPKRIITATPTPTPTPTTPILVTNTPTPTPTVTPTELPAVGYEIYELTGYKWGKLGGGSSHAYRFMPKQAPTRLVLLYRPEVNQPGQRNFDFVLTKDGGEYVGLGSDYGEFLTGEGYSGLIWQGGEAGEVYYMDIINKSNTTIDYCLVSKLVNSWVCE